MPFVMVEVAEVSVSKHNRLYVPIVVKKYFSTGSCVNGILSVCLGDETRERPQSSSIPVMMKYARYRLQASNESLGRVLTSCRLLSVCFGVFGTAPKRGRV